MAKFGIFKGSSNEPLQVIEGDYIIQKDAYIMVYQTTPKGDRQVGTFHVGEGQIVKEIKN
jgi:hypothetical protein